MNCCVFAVAIAAVRCLEALSYYKEQLMARTDSGAKQGRSNRKLDRNGVTSPNYMPLLGCTRAV